MRVPPGLPNRTRSRLIGLLLFGTALFMLGFAPPVVAEIERGQFSISHMLGYRDGGRFEDPSAGERRNIDGDSAWALSASYEFLPGRYYQLWYSRQSTDLGRGGLDIDFEYMHFGGRLDFALDARMIPYLAGGFGATRINARESGLGSELRPGLSLAGGLEFPFSQTVALKLEARGYLTLTDGDREIFCQVANGAACALAYDGNVLTQIDLLAGLKVRF